MKICPNCSFANDERFPTCAFCHTTLVDVPSTPSANPDDPEHERRALAEMRFRTTRGQLRSAGLLYALVIAGSAAFPGMVWTPYVLVLYFVGGIAVAVAVARNMVGQFSASLLQGALSVTLLIYFGPLHPFIFLMLVFQVIIPGIFWHWVELIHGAHR
jgi:hypothetical protein